MCKESTAGQAELPVCAWMRSESGTQADFSGVTSRAFLWLFADLRHLAVNWPMHFQVCLRWGTPFGQAMDNQLLGIAGLLD